MDIDITRVIGRTSREACGGSVFGFRFSVRTGIAAASNVSIAAASARGCFVNDIVTDNADKCGVTVPRLYRTPRLSRRVSIHGDYGVPGDVCFIARRSPWATKLQRRVRAAPIPIAIAPCGRLQRRYARRGSLFGSRFSERLSAGRWRCALRCLARIDHLDRWWRFVIAGAGLVWLCGAQPVRAQPPVPLHPHALAVQLANPDGATARTAMKQIESYLASAPYPQLWPMAWLWPQALLKGRHYRMVLALTLQAILKAPENAGIVGAALRWRMQALLRLHHPRQALAAARGYFDVCDTAQTELALLLIARCLDAAYSDRPQLVQAFVRQQRAGAQPPEPGAQPRTCPILLNIRINPVPFAACLRKNSRFDDPLSMQARANLLLVLGQGAAALRVFQRLRDSYGTYPQYAENIAQALKTRDGTIGSANAWILSLHPVARRLPGEHRN